MPHGSVKLVDGVNQNRTPTLNEAALSSCQLIRYHWDNGAILVEKLGGWTAYYSNPLTAVGRALWAWEDTDAIGHLAIGTQNAPSTTQAQLLCLTNGAIQTITPRSTVDNVTPAASTTSGSNVVTITDNTVTDVTQYDSVYIAVHLSIGGIVLFGLYQCDPNGYVGTNTFTVYSVDGLGNPLNATSTTTTVAVPSLTTTSGSSTVSVVLDNHGYQVGSTFPVLVQTVIGGITFYGNYVVESVTDANTFTIVATNNATSSTTGSINGGNAQFIYNFGVGAVSPGTGYGIGGYGTGGYGTGTAITPSTGTPIAATDWTLDNYGQDLVSVAINANFSPGATAPYQPIYIWDPTSGSPTATAIPAAPPVNDGAFVAMPQRQIVAWGSTVTGIQDPLLIRWSDVNNFNTWIGQPTNQAGQYRLPRGSKIVGCIQGPQQGLIWTDVDLWSMQYIGEPFIYSFNELGIGCGLIGRKAAAALNGIVYWMGPSQFYSLSGNGVEPLFCPVWDVVFQDLDQTNLSKIRVAVNSRFNEIAWYYPTLSSGGEVSAYVKYNVMMNLWDFGSLARSAWIDQSVLGAPIGFDPNALYIYQHETSPDAAGQPMLSSFQTGYFALSDGDQLMFVDQVWPDMKWGYYQQTQNATVNINFYVTPYPGQAPTQFGPYPVTQSTTFFTPRFRGRLVSFSVSSSDTGSFWRLGLIRYRVAPSGKF